MIYNFDQNYADLKIHIVMKYTMESFKLIEANFHELTNFKVRWDVIPWIFFMYICI